MQNCHQPVETRRDANGPLTGESFADVTKQEVGLGQSFAGRGMHDSCMTDFH